MADQQEEQAAFGVGRLLLLARADRRALDIQYPSGAQLATGLSRTCLRPDGIARGGINHLPAEGFAVSASIVARQTDPVHTPARPSPCTPQSARR